MRVEEIIGIVREYFFVALTVIILLGILFSVGYFIIYKKVLKGQKSFSKRKLIVRSMFVGYIIMVIGVTFLNRAPGMSSSIELSLFASYREAWLAFGARNWQFIYLNIVMFVPFGLLLPLLHPRYRKAVWTIGLAGLFTLSIESLQLLTGSGTFDIDDLFNNLLGGIIGYGLMMAILKLKEKRFNQVLVYLSPLLVVGILSSSMFTYYHFKEFGNLSIVPVHKMNMKQVDITMDLKLDKGRKEVPIYKAPSYTKVTGEEFAKSYFERLDIDTIDMEIIAYPSTGIYWIRDDRSHNIWLNYLDGSYSYSDFSSQEENSALKDTNEKNLKEKLAAFDIVIPAEAQFKKTETGSYEWTVDQLVMEHQLLDGFLSVDYYTDDTVKGITNHLITYDKVRNVEIKSVQEAYKEVMDGKFIYFSENEKLSTFHIEKLRVGYELDSKGFYQPVYEFHGIADGEETVILIPGM